MEKDSEMLNISDVDAKKEKPSLNSVHEGGACLPDFNKFPIPSKVLAVPNLYQKDYCDLSVTFCSYVSGVLVIICFGAHHISKFGRCGEPCHT